MGFGGIGKLFKKVGKVVGKVAGSPLGQIGLSFIPGGGIVSALARQGAGALAAKYGGGGAPTVMPGGGVPALPPFALKGMLGGLAPMPGLGVGTGYDPFKSFNPNMGAVSPRTRTAAENLFGARRRRRMNAGNARAARRAIRRIKAVRNLLKGIERQLPKRHVCATRRIGFRRR